MLSSIPLVLASLTQLLTVTALPGGGWPFKEGPGQWHPGHYSAPAGEWQPGHYSEPAGQWQQGRYSTPTWSIHYTAHATPYGTAHGTGGPYRSVKWHNSTWNPTRHHTHIGTGTAVHLPSSIPASLSPSPTPFSSSALISSSQIPSSSLISSSISSSSSAPPSAAVKSDVYRTYTGDGSVQDGWPAMNQWVDFAYMFEYNKANMKISCEQWSVPNDSDQEIEEMRKAILSISTDTGIDARFILAIIMQESTGCVRVITTAYSHANPGLMQSFNGTGSCNDNDPALGVTGAVQTPCPQSEIYQQILDGTNGTIWGPGLKQDYEQQGHTDVSGYYRTARIYNGGSLEADGNLEGPCCTRSYVSDIANRLMGWAYAPDTFNG